MGLEGSIRIDLRLARGAVQQVSLESSRPVHASRVLEGKPVDEALSLLPLLFNVCATAQACAAVRACEQALEIQEAPASVRHRGLLVKLENLREHLWRVFLDWPGWLGAGPDESAMQQLIRLQGALSGVLDPAQELFSPGALPDVLEEEAWRSLMEQLETLLEARLFGQRPAHWLEGMDDAALQAWSRRTDTIAARLLRKVLERDWAASGACDVAPLPLLDGCELADAFADDRFVEAPLWQGEPRETSALTRQQGLLMQALGQHWGNGLLPRLVARLVEVARLCGELRALSIEPPAALSCPGRPGLGLGQAEAARGRLVHQVILEGRRIRRYRILAPTEWNFHPRGVVARGLATLEGDRETIGEQARLLIGSIDPCVACELNLHA
ncbi:nickel-dependent hydrogenase large subunit [Thiolapillus sp.]